MAAQNPNPPMINPPPMLQIPPRPAIQQDQEEEDSQLGSIIDPSCFKVVIMQCTAAVHSGTASVTLDRRRGTWEQLPKSFVSSALSAASNCPIQHLVLKQHMLDTLPAELASPANMLPTSLNMLDLSHNRFVSAPVVLCQLVNLQELYLSNNQITAIPEHFSSLVHLQALHLQNNQLKDFPIGLCGLVSLKYINIEQNELTTLPSEISQLSKLEALHANSNRLEFLPASITNLANLQELHLSQNQLSSLPNDLRGLSSLCQFHLAGNKLKFLPLSFVEMKNLKSFTVSGNSLRYPPLSACRNGVEHLRKFMISKYELEMNNESCSYNPYFETDSDSGEDTPFEDIDD